MNQLFAVVLSLALPSASFANCGNVTEFAVKHTARNANACTAAQGLDGTQTVCWWEFGFRTKAASDLYAVMVRQLQTCGFTLGLPTQDNVNHPDSFEQSIYEKLGYSVSLSIKDKTALGKTLVFITIPMD